MTIVDFTHPVAAARSSRLRHPFQEGNWVGFGSRIVADFAEITASESTPTHQD